MTNIIEPVNQVDNENKQLVLRNQEQEMHLVLRNQVQQMQLAQIEKDQQMQLVIENLEQLK